LNLKIPFTVSSCDFETALLPEIKTPAKPKAHPLLSTADIPTPLHFQKVKI